MEKIIDLHMHTICSDGSLTPNEIVDEAVKNGVSVISITDHDTIDAYDDELFEYAKNKKVKIVKGVEISAKMSKAGIHILGYNINLKDEAFKKALYELRNVRHIYLHKVSEALRNLGYLTNENELNKIDAVTKAHIAKDVIAIPENEKLLIKNFGHIPNMGEFIETVMNEGCPAYIRKNTVTPKDAADIIRKAGGIVVLAHPMAYTYEDGLDIDDMKKLIDEIKPDGVEANYIYYDRNNKRHDDIKKWRKFAKDNNLFVTVGSDFHNKDGVHPVIGLINESFKLTNNEVEEILKNIEII